MIGQINLDSSFGKYINDVSKTFNTIVEIGTWNGRGSTKCIIDALLPRTDDYLFYTIECNLDRYNESKLYWDSILTDEHKSKIFLLHGSILNEDTIISKEILKQYLDFVELWFDEDVNWIKSSENVLYRLPSHIDILLLDGGEYTTYSEFLLLKDRSDFILLDDSNMFKCRQIKEELLLDDNYELVIDCPQERNGYTIFKKRELIDVN